MAVMMKETRWRKFPFAIRGGRCPQVFIFTVTSAAWHSGLLYAEALGCCRHGKNNIFTVTSDIFTVTSVCYRKYVEPTREENFTWQKGGES